MKNLGHLNEESIARFTEHFEDNIEFSESTEDFVDFARCQRPNGTFYGTNGQCRKGTPTSEKAPEKKTARKSAKSAPKRDDSKDLKNKRGTVIGTSPRNMLVDNIKMLEGRLKDSRSEGETKLLKDSITKAKAKLAGEDSAASKAAKASGSGAPTSKEVKALDKTAKAAEKKAEAADQAWRKAGMPKGEQQKEVRRLDKEAKAAEKVADKADRAFQKEAKAKAKLAADPGKAARAEERAAKQLKSAKGMLRMEAKGLKEMRDLGITDSRISAAASRVRNAKMKVEELRNKAAKKSGKARPAKSEMTTRIAREERNIRSQASKGNAKAKQYTDLKKSIQEGRVGDPISARRRLSALRSELKPASPNQ